MAENNKPIKQDEFGQATPAREQSKTKRGARGGKKRVSLNAFDLIIIFLVLLVVVLFAVGVRVGDLFGVESGASTRLTYTVLMTDVDEDFVGSVRVGDLVYDADSGVEIGTVCMTPTTTPHCVVGVEEIVPDTDSPFPSEPETRVAMKPVPGRVDMTVTVVCDAFHFENRGYEVKGRTIRIGDVYTLRFPNYVGDAVCSGLTVQTTK